MNGMIMYSVLQYFILTWVISGEKLDKVHIDIAKDHKQPLMHYDIAFVFTNMP